MLLNTLIQLINNKLAGETLSFSQLSLHLDSTIDDINSKLNSKFPAFSEFQSVGKNVYEQYPDYDFFPDKYLRSVVSVGAAYYFYLTDEEGIAAAEGYAQEYHKNLFYMERDYIEDVPEEWEDKEQGFIETTPTYGVPSWFHDLF